MLIKEPFITYMGGGDPLFRNIWRQIRRPLLKNKLGAALKNGPPPLINCEWSLTRYTLQYIASTMLGERIVTTDVAVARSSAV